MCVVKQFGHIEMIYINSVLFIVFFLFLPPPCVSESFHQLPQPFIITVSTPASISTLTLHTFLSRLFNQPLCRLVILLKFATQRITLPDCSPLSSRSPPVVCASFSSTASPRLNQQKPLLLSVRSCSCSGWLTSLSLRYPSALLTLFNPCYNKSFKTVSLSVGCCIWVMPNTYTLSFLIT